MIRLVIIFVIVQNNGWLAETDMGLSSLGHLSNRFLVYQILVPKPWGPRFKYQAALEENDPSISNLAVHVLWLDLNIVPLGSILSITVPQSLLIPHINVFCSRFESLILQEEEENRLLNYTATSLCRAKKLLCNVFHRHSRNHRRKSHHYLIPPPSTAHFMAVSKIFCWCVWNRLRQIHQKWGDKVLRACPSVQ